MRNALVPLLALSLLAGAGTPASAQQRLRERIAKRSRLPMLLVCSSTRRIPTSPCDEARKFARRGGTLEVPMRVLPEPLEHGEINDRLGLPSSHTRAVSGWIEQILTHVNP